MPWVAVKYAETLDIKAMHENPALPTLKVYKSDGGLLFENAKLVV